MAAPVYRDEFEKRLDEAFVRSVDYTNSVLDVQRVKTVRQIVQDIGADIDKKLAIAKQETSDEIKQSEQRILTMVDQRFQVNEQHLQGYGQTLQEHGRTLQEHTFILQEHSRTLQEHTLILQEHSRTLQEHTLILQEHSRMLQDLTRIVRAIAQALNVTDI